MGTCKHAAADPDSLPNCAASVYALQCLVVTAEKTTGHHWDEQQMQTARFAVAAPVAADCTWAARDSAVAGCWLVMPLAAVVVGAIAETVVIQETPDAWHALHVLNVRQLPALAAVHEVKSAA